MDRRGIQWGRDRVSKRLLVAPAVTMPQILSGCDRLRREIGVKNHRYELNAGIAAARSLCITCDGCDMTRAVAPEEPPEVGAAKLQDRGHPSGLAGRPERPLESRNALLVPPAQHRERNRTQRLPPRP